MPLCAVPAKPNQTILRDAHSILARAIESAQSFFQAFVQVRKARNAKGAPTDHEQDLLRAALMFAAAGLDSMVKQLARDTLGVIISADEGAKRQFREYVQGRLAKTENVDLKYLTRALVSDNPREHLKAELVSEITGSSLQSKDQLLRVAAYFAIGPDGLTADVNKLRVIFEARNQIAHEMDILLGQSNRGRRSRTYDVMHDYTSFVLHVACAFYGSIEKKIAAPSESKPRAQVGGE